LDGEEEAAVLVVMRSGMLAQGARALGMVATNDESVADECRRLGHPAYNKMA
jgi:hypothetical protein